MTGEYYKTKESVEEYIKAAEGFDGADLIRRFQEVLPPQSRVLEIGSGPGSDWKILNETFNVVGSDNSQEFVDHLKKNFPDGDFLKLDATKLMLDQVFDGIYSNKVLHHLTDEALTSSIARQYGVLSEGGYLCHSFWKGEGSEVFKGLFVNYHCASDLRALFEKFFDIILLEEYEEFEANDSLLLIGKKKKL